LVAVVAIAAEVKDRALLEEKFRVAVASEAAFLIVVGMATGQKLHTCLP
jgi:hypothetical protein